jgi:hypothetical protein
MAFLDGAAGLDCMSRAPVFLRHFTILSVHVVTHHVLALELFPRAVQAHRWSHSVLANLSIAMVGDRTPLCPTVRQSPVVDPFFASLIDLHSDLVKCVSYN